MPETPPTPPNYNYPPGMMPPPNIPAVAPGAPAPDAAAAASGAKSSGGGSPQTAGAAFISNLDADIRSVA